MPEVAAGEPAPDPWESVVLRQVNTLADFSMVVVITAGTESARTWAEQASPWTGTTPLVMVLSAGAEPLVRPYYEALDPQVNGILTGLPAAVVYEERVNRQPGPARSRWDAFGTGMLAAEIILGIGAIYGAFAWLIRPPAGKP
jgi:hypothetical protein